MEKVTSVWKTKLPSTMIYADSVSFLTATDDRIQKYSSMSVAFPTWTNPKVNSLQYVKKMSALQWLRVYNHDFVTTKVCLDIPDGLLTNCFKRLSCDVSLGKNADLSGMARAF